MGSEQDASRAGWNGDHGLDFLNRLSVGTYLFTVYPDGGYVASAISGDAISGGMDPDVVVPGLGDAVERLRVEAHAFTCDCGRSPE